MPILISTGNVLMEGRRAAETPLLALRAEVIVNPDSGAAAQIQPVRESWSFLFSVPGVCRDTEALGNKH